MRGLALGSLFMLMRYFVRLSSGDAVRSVTGLSSHIIMTFEEVSCAVQSSQS